VEAILFGLDAGLAALDEDHELRQQGKKPK
jgi:hypothetical protein